MDRITPRDTMLLARQLATLMRAGVPILHAFDILADSLTKPSMVTLIQQLKRDVTAGTSIAEALDTHAGVIDRLFINMVAAGEQSGTLDRMLERIAAYKERVETLKARVKKAMYYPAAVLLVGVGVTVLLLVEVVPQFETLFHGAGAELPAMTRLTVTLSAWIQQYGGWGLAMMTSGVLTMRRGIRRSPRMAYYAHALSLYTPVIGDILDKAAMARYARTLATLYDAGVPLPDALDTAANSTDNRVYEVAIAKVKRDVATGQSLHGAMRSTQQFSALAIQMVAIGEEAGSLDTMLDRTADYYEEEVENRVDSLISLLEPVIIVVLGILVGGLVVSMYLPIFELGGTL